LIQAQGHNTDAKAGGIAPGIAVFAYGKRGYYAAAEHLAVTLKENSPGVPIYLWAGDVSQVDHTLFTAVYHLDAKWYERGPGSLKTQIYDILPDGEWLYMDADSLVVADLAPHIQRLKGIPFALDVRGVGKEADAIHYTHWATNATVKRVCNLPDDATYYGVQSSVMWISKPSKVCADVFAAAKAAPFTIKDLNEKWGSDIPDELSIAAGLSITGHTPHNIQLCFYGSNKTDHKGLASVASEFPILCLYGDNRQHRLVSSGWFNDYDRMLRNVYAKQRRNMRYSLHRVMGDKYVNQ